MVQPNRRGSISQQGIFICARRTLNSTELPKLILTMNLGVFCGPNKGSLSQCQRTHELGPTYWFTTVGTSFLPHKGDKNCATFPHKPITPSQMALHVQSCMHTDSRAQAVSYDLWEIDHPKVIKILKKHASSDVSLSPTVRYHTPASCHL